MFYMKNRTGNVYKKARTIHKKEELEALGYVCISDDGEAVETDIEVEAEAGGSEFDKMTVPELKAYAVDNGIEITATKKADIIAEIEKTLVSGAESVGANDEEVE